MLCQRVRALGFCWRQQKLHLAQFRARHGSALAACEANIQMSAKEREFFNANGYVKIPKALSQAAVADVKSWVADIASWPEAAGAWMHHFETSMAEKGKLNLTRTENFSPYHAGMATLLNKGVPAQLAGSALGGEAVLYKEKINYKAPGGAGYAAHQDAPAYPEADRHVTCLLAMDGATLANGCLEFASFPWARKDFIGLTQAGTISDDVVNELEFQPVETDPGDVIIFSSYVPHRSKPNTSSRPRRLLYLTYNKESLGDLRSAYYTNKRANMLKGRLSNIGHFEGDLVKMESEAAPELDGASSTSVAARRAVMEKIGGLFAERGATRYDSFSTQEEHALMTAYMAQQNGASQAVVVAAFLHDLGHLLLNEHAGRGDFLASDKHHEQIGYRFLLRNGFPEEVTEPVRLHVDAKRYLCASDHEYYSGLSEASKRSLELQGGALTEEEAAAWSARPFARAAAELRRWEDEGKQMWARGDVTHDRLPSVGSLLAATGKVLEANAPA